MTSNSLEVHGAEVVDATTRSRTDDVADLDDVDWLAFWQEFGCPVDEHMSWTQFQTAVEISDQNITAEPVPPEAPQGPNVPEGLIAQWTTAAEDEDHAPVLRGIFLLHEVRRDD